MKNTLRPVTVAALLGLLGGVDQAHAADPALGTSSRDTDHVGDEACNHGAWRLDGASARAEPEGSATLPAHWVPILEQMAGCLRLPEHAWSCLQVEGRFDEVAFPPAVTRVFGSVEAAQRSRARGRSSAVIDRLLELGVSSERLRERSPSQEPSWRGASVTLVSDCLPRPREMSEEDRQLVETARRQLSSPPPQPEAPVQTIVVEREVSRGPAFFVDAGGWASLSSTEATSHFAPLTHLALGATSSRFVARLGGGLAWGSRQAQRASWELRTSAGYQPLAWLEVLGTAGWRFGSVELDAPWLERSWFAGLEGRQCLLTFGDSTDLCLHEALLPFGSETRRAQVSGGSIERLPPTSDSLFRFELGAIVRHQL